METHEKHRPDVPLGPILQSLYLRIGEFPAGKMTVEGFSFLPSKVCDPGKVRNMMFPNFSVSCEQKAASCSLLF